MLQSHAALHDSVTLITAHIEYVGQMLDPHYSCAAIRKSLSESQTMPRKLREFVKTTLFDSRVRYVNRSEL